MADGSIILDTKIDEGGLESGLSKLGGAVKTGLTTALTAATAAVTATTAAFARGAAQTASYGDNVDKMSQKLGMSAEAYQEWDAIMQHCGTSIEAMQPSMKTLATAVESGSDAFEKLGMSQEEIANMSQEELFSATISALQNVEDETERTYLAGKLLGRGATELGALLNTSAEDTEAMRQRVHELGGVMSDEAVKASAAYQDSLQDMQTSFSGLSRNLMAEFLPAMTTVMDGLTEIFSGDSEAGLGLVKEGISSFIGQMNEMIPQVIEIGGGIVTSLMEAIIENLPGLIEAGSQAILSLSSGLAEAIPTLIPMAAQAVTSIITGLLDNIPALVEAALALVMGLADGLLAAIPVLIEAVPQIITSLVAAVLHSIPQIIQAGIDLLTSLVTALPQIIQAVVDAIPRIVQGIVLAVHGNIPLIIQAGIQLLVALIQALPQIISTIVPAIPQIVSSIVNAFANNIPLIVQAGVQLLGSLITNLPSIIATLIKAVPQIVKSLVSAFTGLIPQMIEAGKNLLLGLGQGIANAVGSVINKALEVGRKIVNSVKSFFGINSPSKLFRDTIGANLVAGLAEGLTDNAQEAMAAAEDLASDLAGVSFTMQDPQMNVEPPKVDLDPDDYDYSGLLARVRGAVATETAAAGAAVSAGRAAELYRGSGQGNDTPGAENGSSRPKTVYAEVKLDGKTVARQLGPYMEKELEWRDK